MCVVSTYRKKQKSIVQVEQVLWRNIRDCWARPKETQRTGRDLGFLRATAAKIAIRRDRAVTTTRELPLHVFPWRREMSRTGLQRNALYLVRPDGYVAFADPTGSATAMIDYLNARKLAQITARD